MLGLDPRDWHVLVLAGLATWRLTSLLVYEAGPFAIFERIRRATAASALSELFLCFHCAAVWIAALVCLLAFRPALSYVLLIPGLAGFASIIEWRISPLREQDHVDS